MKDENIKGVLPKHVALIMDGNGRWAQNHGVPTVAGHNKGMLAMKEIIKKADVMGIKYLTVYAFSTENWKRSQEEISGIFGLLVKFVASQLMELNENNVKVHILGDYRDRVPEKAIKSIEKALFTTRDNDGLQFNIALNYGSRGEILRAVKQIAEDIASDRIRVDEIDEKIFSEKLYTGDENGNIPDPDLIIRTGGEFRLSNFLLWQGAYSELFFSPSLWPDFGPEEFEDIIGEFSGRNRRFGGRKEKA